MIYDNAFVRAIAQARVDRLIAEADAFRASRGARARDRARVRRIVRAVVAWIARRVRRSVPGWPRSRRRAAVPIPHPRLGEDSPQ